MIVMTIINAVILVCMIVLTIMIYNMITSFGELIVRFIEQNQEYYKSQQHMINKTANIISDCKKLSGHILELKRYISKLELNFNNKEDKLSSEITKLSNVAKSIKKQ